MSMPLSALRTRLHSGRSTQKSNRNYEVKFDLAITTRIAAMHCRIQDCAIGVQMKKLHSRRDEHINLLVLLNVNIVSGKTIIIITRVTENSISTIKFYRVFLKIYER